jgi:DNA-binding NarL/FixJ family response regulator
VTSATVLLAEDNEAMRRDIRQLIECEFEVVAAVSDGDQLLDQGLSATADVIVADISMPGTDGITAARLLRERGCRSAIVFLSVHRERAVIAAALATGALGYVVKSRAADDLIPAIRAALRGERFRSCR